MFKLRDVLFSSRLGRTSSNWVLWSAESYCWYFEKDVSTAAITAGFRHGILVVSVTPESSPMLAVPAAAEPSPVSRSNQGRESSID